MKYDEYDEICQNITIHTHNKISIKNEEYMQRLIKKEHYAESII